ncbi:MAG: hypothetical protein ABII23_08645 [bacterium]
MKFEHLFWEKMIQIQEMNQIIAEGSESLVVQGKTLQKPGNKAVQ